MRNPQGNPVYLSTISIAKSNPADHWARMAKMTLLAMAVSLLFLAWTCHALTTTADTTSHAAVAQAPADANPTGPPDAKANVRVVRLSDVEGTVQIVRDNQTEFSHAVMNMPLTQGSRVETGPDGRAEIEFEDGSVIRITPNSSVNLANLSMAPSGTLETTLQQLSGLVYYELRSDPRSTFTVSVADSKVTPTVNSTFRVSVSSNPADLAVMDGRVQIQGTTSEDSTEVAQGKSIDFKPSGSTPYTLADGIVPNGFDEWNDQRDQEAAKQAANQTPARTQQGGGSMLEGGWGYGWGDLDAYGGWYPLPGYGMVWQPNGVGPGFDPYGYGSWANVGGFGVSWVSGYPWGWLPFQCGGWSYIGSFGWGWMPGGCGFGGIGFGYGFGYGRYYGGRYWHGHPGWGRGTARIYSAPAGYHTPTAPANLRGGLNGARSGENIVHVGSPATAAHGFANNGHSENHARAVEFNGTKVAPLHSVPGGGNISMRNAALANNAPARSLQGGMTGRSQTFAARGGNQMGSVNGLHGTASQMRAANGAAFQSRSSFGQHAAYGSHGSFHGTATSFNGGGYRGGSPGGSFHGASSGGGVHGGSGGGGGGGFHGGGGGGSFGGGGGGHAGGGGGGGGGGHH
jgi:FecR protein